MLMLGKMILTETMTTIWTASKRLVVTFATTASGMDITQEPKVMSGNGEITFPVETPGDMTRLRFGLSGRVHDAKDNWDQDEVPF